jgi:ketosteroid isomerase-like protein
MTPEGPRRGRNRDTGSLEGKEAGLSRSGMAGMTPPPQPGVTPNVREMPAVGSVSAPAPVEAPAPAAPGIVIEPAFLDFGVMDPGKESKPLSVRITNNGAATVSGDVRMDCPDFNFRSGDGDFELKPGRSREIRVRFKPTSAGPRSCSIETGLGRIRLAGAGDAGSSSPAATPEPAAAGAGLSDDDKAGIRKTIQQYEAALEALSATKFVNLWATGRGPGERFLSDRFARYKTQEVQVTAGDFRKDGTHAVVPLTTRSHITLVDGTTQDVSQKGSMRLIRASDGRWLIYDLQLN